jgi:hypothetical protein
VEALTFVGRHRHDERRCRGGLRGHCQPHGDAREDARRSCRARGAPRSQLLVSTPGWRRPGGQDGIRTPSWCPWTRVATRKGRPGTTRRSRCSRCERIQSVPAEHVQPARSYFSGTSSGTPSSPRWAPASAGRGCARPGKKFRGVRGAAAPAARGWTSGGPERWYLTAGQADEKVPDRSRFREAFVKALIGFAQASGREC